MSQQLQSRAREVPATVVSRLPSTGTLSTIDHREASLWLEAAREESCQVIAPGTEVPIMPHGAGVVCSRIWITDTSEKSVQVYPSRGDGSKVSLHKGPLDEIGRAFGMDWPTAWTWDEPFGDERDHHPYCKKITVAGRYKDWDGTWKNLPPQTKEIDLRDGSPDVELIYIQQHKKAIKELKTTNPTQPQLDYAKRNADESARIEIAQLRKFIRSHAQTKARLMVIRTLVRTSFTKEELKKPITVFRYIFTGRSNNPEIELKFAEHIAAQQLGPINALYGEPKQLTGNPAQNDAGVVAEVRPEPTDEPPWEVPFGPFTGKVITDPSLQRADLEELLTYYRMAVQANNNDSDALAMEKIDAEIQRRFGNAGNKVGSIDDAAQKVEQAGHDDASTIPFGPFAGMYLDDSGVTVEGLNDVLSWCVDALANPQKEGKPKIALLKAALEVELRRRNAQPNL